MAVTYKRLFHLLIDRGIQTTELTEKAGFSAKATPHKHQKSHYTIGAQ